jgi:hypothetical protein
MKSDLSMESQFSIPARRGLSRREMLSGASLAALGLADHFGVNPSLLADLPKRRLGIAAWHEEPIRD